jgi:hypothetical protein
LIPEHKYQEYTSRKEKRLQRYMEYKNMLLDEIVEMKADELDAAL